MPVATIIQSPAVKLPVVQRNLTLCRIAWRAPAYHSIMQILQNPIYAGAYAFGRRGTSCPRR